MRDYMRNFVTESLAIISRESEGSLLRCDEHLKALLDTVPYLNVRDKSAILGVLRQISRRSRLFSDPTDYLALKSTFDALYSVCYRMERRSIGRVTENSMHSGMRKNRNRDIPIIFYLCPAHQNARQEHRALQGRIYVDRYWRSVTPQDQHGVIAEIIAKNKMMTVQEVMGAPYYLITAPDCHHILVPLDTDEILSARDIQQIVAGHQIKGFHREHKDNRERVLVRRAHRLRTAARVLSSYKKARS